MKKTSTLQLDVDSLGNPFAFALADSAGRALPWVIGGIAVAGGSFLIFNGITNAKRKSENKNALDPSDAAFLAKQLLEALKYDVAGWDLGWDRDRFFEIFESIQTMRELNQILKSFEKLNNGKDLMDAMEAEYYVYDSDFDRMRAHTETLK